MTQPSQRIYVDFDDVLSQTAVKLIEVLEKTFNKTIPYESIVSFNLEQSFALTSEQWNHLMDLAHTSDVLMEMKMISGAQKAMSHLYDKGFQIDIVTGRPPDTIKHSQDWLNEHKIPYHNIYFADKYLRFSELPGIDKSHYFTLEDLKKESFTFAIEDSATMAQFISEQMNIPVYLLDRPWNRKASTSNPDAPIFRCHSWQELTDQVSDRH